MSTYYTYYLGYKDKEGIIRPLGPWDKDGKHLAYIYSQNASWGDDLNEEFFPVTEDKASPELIEMFSEEHLLDGHRYLNLSQLSLSEVSHMGIGGGLRFGYVPTKLITQQENHKVNPNDYEDVADDLNLKSISPIEYSALSEKSREKYAYYAWLDTDCNAYTAWRISLIAYEMAWQYYGETGGIENVVVLMTVS